MVQLSCELERLNQILKQKEQQLLQNSKRVQEADDLAAVIARLEQELTSVQNTLSTENSQILTLNQRIRKP